MRQTPWGYSQQEEVIAPGIISVSTPSHGGIWLDPEHRRRIKWSKNWLGTSEWWEEDCDWAIPYYFFRDEIAEDNKKAFLDAAIRTIKGSHPDFAKREGL